MVMKEGGQGGDDGARGGKEMREMKEDEVGGCIFTTSPPFLLSCSAQCVVSPSFPRTLTFCVPRRTFGRKGGGIGPAELYASFIEVKPNKCPS